MKIKIGTKESISKRQKKNSNILLQNIVWILLIVSFLVIGIIEPIFFSMQIFANILIQATVLGVLTAGLSFVILLGEIDLSVVGIMAFSAALGTISMKSGLNWFLAIIMIIVIGTLFGFINGWLISKLKAVSLIETLAMGVTLSGGVMAVTQGRSVVEFPQVYKFVGQGRIGGLPVLPFIFILIYIIVYIVWNRTAFGRSLYAVGGNAKSAFVSGINVHKVRILAFTVSGFLAGISGFLLSSYMGAVTSTFGTSYSMDTIAASVIGGVSLSGGRGNIAGVLGGVLLLTVIQVGLQILGISSYFVEMVGGLMILVAVLIDSIRLKVQG